MKRLFRITIISILIIFLSGTIVISAKKSKGDPEKEALLFGCFDLTEIDSYLVNVNFMEYSEPKFKIKNFYVKLFDTYHGGLYIADQVKPGQYWLMAFFTRKYGLQFQNKITECKVCYKPIEADLFTVKAGDIYFYGTYKYRVAQKAKLFSDGKFNLEKVDTPSEKELLQMALEKLKGSKWEAKIHERLAKL